MRHEIEIGGILVSPFVAYALGAFAILLLLRILFRKLRFSRYVANPPLAEAGVYVCVLGALIFFLR